MNGEFDREVLNTLVQLLVEGQPRGVDWSLGGLAGAGGESAGVPGLQEGDVSLGMMPVSPGDIAKLLQLFKGLLGRSSGAYMGPLKGSVGGGQAALTPSDVPMTPGITRGSPLPPANRSGLDQILSSFGDEAVGISGNVQPKMDELMLAELLASLID